MLRRPQDEGDVAGWRILVGFDGFNMKPRGRMPEILASETLKRAIPVFFAALTESLLPDSVSTLTELRDALTPLIVSRPGDTSNHARLADKPMLR